MKIIYAWDDNGYWVMGWWVLGCLMGNGYRNRLDYKSRKMGNGYE